MASNLGRLFASITKQSEPKLVLPHTRSDFYLISASRLVHYSIQLSQAQKHHQEEKEEAPISEIEKEAQDQNEKDEVEDADDEDDVNVNKETGEVGGPRGPEPTRYGDWERNGRCYDF